MKTITLDSGDRLSVEHDGYRGHDGRDNYRWTVEIKGNEGFTVFSEDGLHSGANGFTDDEALESLLGFLTAAAEAYGYQLRTGRESDNAALFPKEVVEWAYQHSDEISLRELEIREEREEKATTVPHGYEVWHDSDMEDEDGNPMPAGWYWWACFPGCMPDGDPMGPFPTKRAAIADIREGMDE